MREDAKECQFFFKKIFFKLIYLAVPSHTMQDLQLQHMGSVP